MRTSSNMKHGLALGLTVGLLVWMLGACAEVSKEDTSTSAPKSSVERTENADGSVTGAFAKGATEDQTLVGAGEQSETQIIVPPGAITVDTNVTMADGEALEGNLLPEELGLKDVAILGGTTPLSIEADQTADLGNTFTLALPIPLDEVKDAEGTKLNLLAGTAKVAIMFLVKTDDGNKIGLFVPGKDDLLGMIIQYKGARFGWFRFVVLSSAVDTVEVDSTREPPGKVK